jgi:glycosyltransferase involved in cell wall biosynthesis/peptidoglycan/xylan/chitin deacetylase (PgdA/CDA1 family)
VPSYQPLPDGPWPNSEATPGDVHRPRISVVVPTYQRRELVLAGVRALAEQSFDRPYEVIVAVDGSSDGSTAALRGLAVPFPLTVLEQSNAGASSARNLGARQARGDILLFLDDDMEADPHLLAEHDRLHGEGADAVLGHMPLHPGSAPTAISAAVGDWSEERLARLSRPGAELTLHDLLTGQLSVSADVFRALGGFDLAFTRGGSFGNEDVDFGHRLLRAGYDVRFNPRAVSHQRYVVTARQHLRQWRQAGRADVVFARKHPEQALSLFELNGLRDPFAVRFSRPLAAAPAQLWGPLTWPVRALGSLLGDRRGRFALESFVRARSMEYWRGVREAGGIPDRSSLRVLSYHAVSDLHGRGVLEPYGIPLDQLRQHLASLTAWGFHPVFPEEFAAFAAGLATLPRRAVLLTFDDGYADLVEAAAALSAEGVGALVFAVSGLLGGQNDWDRVHGGPPMPLLDASGLRRLRAAGFEIGGHSRTHPQLPTLDRGAIEAEVSGCVADLEALGLGPVRFFAYPYGESDECVREVARRVGLAGAFTVRPGVMTASTDRMQIPRVEILRKDQGLRFIAKVLFASHLGWSTAAVGATRVLARRFAHGGRRRLCGLRRRRSVAADPGSLPRTTEDRSVGTPDRPTTWDQERGG